ncbi:alpha/beta fold hydrolase [Halomonas cerina]|uniref:Haloalkane dehalogenase n=1 Tax=Halomonas cerina TaxID=447424 RepID=A0A839VH04_9GAMM|nr:alpha/beta fold hydrolase [Halomonas cerina]MBB3192589.1 haloalkane dehalogenase [Halomonas cerina]
MNDLSWIDWEAYPFASRYFRVPAGRLHYVDEGAGSPILMVHGNPTWSFLYRDLIKRFRSTYRCIAVDHLGFGLSDKPKEWSYLPEDHARNLAALIDDLELGDITLVLQDWGGPIGLSCAVARPDRIARLVLMNTWTWPVNRDVRFVAFSGVMGGPVGRWLIRRYNVFARLLLPLAFADRRKLSASTHRHYLHPLATPAERTGCLVFPKQILASTPWLARLWRDMSRLNGKPTLLVWGMKDMAFRATELKRWEQAFPEARSVRLDSVGHFVPEEAPDELVEALETFLAATERA